MTELAPVGAEERGPALERTVQASPPRDHGADMLLRCWAEQRGDLLRYCQRSLGRADGEDAFSRATVAMLRAASSAEGLRRPQAWLQRIVRCACVDVHRERTRRGRHLVLTRSGEDLGELAAVQPALRDPERSFLERETLARLNNAIRDLPPWLRVPFLLRVEDDLPYADMATILFDSEESLRKRVQLARQTVRRSVLCEEGAPLRAIAGRLPASLAGEGDQAMSRATK